MKAKTRNVLFIVFMFISLLLSSFLLFMIFGTGNYNSINSYDNLRISVGSDISYIPQENQFYDDYNLNASSTFNLINHTKVYSDIYNATYSHTSGSEAFITSDNSEAGCDYNIISYYDYHDYVLNGSDPSDVNTCIMENAFSAQDYGTIELWIQVNKNEATSFHLSLLDDSDNTLLRFRFRDDSGLKIQARDLASWSNLISANINQWYHIIIDFEASTGSYLGLAQYDYYMSIDGVRYGTYDFETNNDDATTIELKAGSDFDGEHYVDAIDYSWKPAYFYNKTILPLIDSYIDTYQVKDFSFAHDNDGNLVSIGSDYSYFGWSEIDPSNYVKVQGSDEDTDREIELSHSTTDTLGIYKNNFGINENQINITYKYSFGLSQNVGTEYFLEIYSYDSTLICKIKITVGSPLSTIHYYDGSSYNLIRSFNDNWQDKYYINIYMNDNIVCYKYQKNNNNPFRYYFNKLSYKYGLNKLNISGVSPDTDNQLFWIDNIGVYYNGTSASNDFYNIEYPIYNGTNYWFYKRRTNLLKYTINGTGSLTFQESDSAYSFTISTFRNFSNIERIYNIYNYTFKYNSGFTGYKPYLVLSTNMSTIPDIYHVELEGLSLSYNNISYYPYYYFSDNVNIHDNYFYYSNNAIRYLLNCTQSGTEYIQCEFDIDDISSTNRSISVNHKKSHNRIYSELRLYYDDTSYSYIFSDIYPQSTNIILPQSKTTYNITILISDNNEYSAFNYGYFKTITLVYYPNLQASITTLSFFGIIPFVFAIIIVPLIFTMRTKLRFLFLPLVILMSIICTLTNLVPTWLGVIVIIFCVSYYFITKKFD